MCKLMGWEQYIKINTNQPSTALDFPFQFIIARLANQLFTYSLLTMTKIYCSLTCCQPSLPSCNLRFLNCSVLHFLIHMTVHTVTQQLYFLLFFMYSWRHDIIAVLKVCDLELVSLMLGKNICIVCTWAKPLVILSSTCASCLPTQRRHICIY